MMQWPEGR